MEIVLQYSGLEGCLIDEVVSQYTWCIVTGAGGLAWIVLQYEVCRKKKLYCKRRLEGLRIVLQYNYCVVTNTNNEQ